VPEIIYSRAEEGLVLLVINRMWEISEDRTDVCSEDQLLQISTKRLSKGTTFQPHKHNVLKRDTNTTHEAWIILKGAIVANVWEIVEPLIHETVVRFGECGVVY